MLVVPAGCWLSLSARRAWIEMVCNNFVSLSRFVALRKESVDRNSIELVNIKACIVALRKESVDRNSVSTVVATLATLVALRKESVDRNVNLRVLDGSKSVALRKESVDRNANNLSMWCSAEKSLSARRAWIEMDGVVSGSADYVQSLSARRAWIEMRVGSYS